MDSLGSDAVQYQIVLMLGGQFLLNQLRVGLPALHRRVCLFHPHSHHVPLQMRVRPVELISREVPVLLRVYIHGGSFLVGARVVVLLGMRVSVRLTLGLRSSVSRRLDHLFAGHQVVLRVVHFVKFII